MNKSKKLGAAAVAVAMLVGASAFAESRPHQGTRSEGGRIQRGDRGSGSQSRAGSASRSGSQAEVRGERNTTRSRETTGARETTRQRETTGARETTRQRETTTRQRETSGTYEQRNTDRSRGSNARNRGTYDRNRGSNDRNRGTYDRNRGSNDRNPGTYDRNRGSNDRNRGTYDRNRGSNDRNRGSYDRNRGSYGNRGGYSGRPYYHNGPVSRYQRYGSGYRVWITGAQYPFYVPLAYWDPWRFRVGVSINLGGYYNSLGYYDYYDGYDDGYRAGTYRDGRVYQTENLSGTIEEYDERRRTALIRDDVTDRLVTVYMHSRDARLNHIRPGDYIELEGGWKGGIFEAYRVFDVD